MTEADWIKGTLAAITTALGVLLGLLGNSYVQRRREVRAHQSLLRAIANEARSNRDVLSGFWKHYSGGIVLQEFNTEAVKRCLGDQQFIKYADSEYLNNAYEYLRNLCLANSYRRKNEELRFNQKDAEQWLESLIDAWRDNLSRCDKSIEAFAPPNSRSDRTSQKSHSPKVANAPKFEPSNPDERTLTEAHLDLALGNNYRMEYIKHLMSIAAGAFVFSVTFTKDMLGEAQPSSLMNTILLASWAALALSTLAGIFHMRFWAQYYINWGLHYENPSAKRWRYKLNRWRKIADTLQVSCFAVGLAAMLIFAATTLIMKPDRLSFQKVTDSDKTKQEVGK